MQHYLSHYFCNTFQFDTEYYKLQDYRKIVKDYIDMFIMQLA